VLIAINFFYSTQIKAETNLLYNTKRFLSNLNHLHDDKTTLSKLSIHTPSQSIIKRGLLYSIKWKYKNIDNDTKINIFVTNNKTKDSCNKSNAVLKANVNIEERIWGVETSELKYKLYYICFNWKNRGKSFFKFSKQPFRIVGWHSILTENDGNILKNNFNNLIFDKNNSPIIALTEKINNNKFKVILITKKQQKWSTIKIPKIYVQNPNWVSIEKSNNENIYIIYRDNNKYIKIIKHNDKWTDLNNIKIGKALGDSIKNNFSIAFNKNNTPYIAYIEAETKKAKVKKLGSKNIWQDIGISGYASDVAGYAKYISLAISSTGIPCIAYQSQELNSKRAKMRCFLAKFWQDINPTMPYISDEDASYISLAFNKNDIPFVAFRDEIFDNRITVIKLINGIWEDVSSTGISNNPVSQISLSFDKTTEPWILHITYANDNTRPICKASAKKLINQTWQEIGNEEISNISVSNLSFILDNFSNPYIAFNSDDSEEKFKIYRFSTKMN
jgi:hypothetical protein